MDSVTTLIVEDERLASAALKRMLSSRPSINNLGIAADGKSAVEKIQKLRPDIVFLDIEMPELDAFEIIEQIGIDSMPAIIFVTAYDRYTLRAFEVHALDYLLKPFGEERFQAAVDHAVKHLERRREVQSKNLAGLLEGPRSGGRLPVKTSGRTIFVELIKVDYLEASGNYIRIHVGATEYLTRETMNSFEERLRPYDFVRIHRSVMVNRYRIQSLKPWYTGEYVVTLTTGKELTLSRGYRAHLPLLTQES